VHLVTKSASAGKAYGTIILRAIAYTLMPQQSGTTLIKKAAG
jgi:hypothetical protein